MRNLASAANPLIKVFRHALEQGVTREGWVAVEGPLLVGEAVQAALGSRNGSGARSVCSVRTVLVARGAAAKFAGLLSSLPPGVEVAVTADSNFERIASTVTPQGIAALVELSPPSLDAVLSAKDVILMAAFGVQDPGNLGTILRSSEALGADALVTLQNTVSPFNPKAVRASGGAFFRLPVFAGLESAEFFARLRKARVRVVGASRRSPRNVAEIDLRGRLAFLIGNEAAGLPAETNPDDCVCIPVLPGVDSLNAAMAAAILLYEAARQRRFQY